LKQTNGRSETGLLTSASIRRCTASDFDSLVEIINDAAQAYRDVIPEDRWKEPYMPADELRHEIEAGVEFWGSESEGVLLGVMGSQPVHDVTLIRHAYVRRGLQQQGIGGRLLEHLRALTARPILIGTWAAATWAISFYRKHGFRLAQPEEKDALLHRYWSIPERQIETSVVLLDERFRV
jgi:N-acetylglutamate synthase-like GNAT family acetyltransferase